MIWTKDERDSKRPLKPFPAELEYLRVYVEVMHNEDLLFVDKSRQMYISTCTLLYVMWQCMFLPFRRWVLSKATEDEAKLLLRDKVRLPYTMLPQFLQKWSPLAPRPDIRAIFKGTQSDILAAAENVAQRELRGVTCSGAVIDEAARQATLEAILAAALVNTEKVFVISTAEIGNDGAVCMREYLDDPDAEVEGASAGLSPLEES